MGFVTKNQSKSKRRKRKLFVEDRSFFGDESLVYPEVNQRTVDGDLLKLKRSKKTQSQKLKVNSIQQRKCNSDNWQQTEKVLTAKCDIPFLSVDAGHYKFDQRKDISLCRTGSNFCAHLKDLSVRGNEIKMEKPKRKRQDTLESNAPAASKKSKTDSFDADAHDDGQLDENSPIIDVLRVSPDVSDHTEPSCISGHHEEWHFSTPENSEVDVISLNSDGDCMSENQSEKKKDFVHRFLSDALSTLGMEEKFLDDLSDDKEFSSDDDITEAADLISSHNRKQSKNIESIPYGNAWVHKKVAISADLEKAKYSQSINEFSVTSPLTSGQKWLLRQISPFKNGTSTANSKERCTSPISTTLPDSEESIQVLEHIKPSINTAVKIRRKKGKKNKEKREEKTKNKKRKWRKGKDKERDAKRQVEDNEEFLVTKNKEKESKKRLEKIQMGKQQNQEKKRRKGEVKQKSSKLELPKPRDATNSNIDTCPLNDLEGCVIQPNEMGRKNKIHTKKKKVNVEVQLTKEEILHPSSIRNPEGTVSSHKNQSNDERLSSVKHTKVTGNRLETHEIYLKATDVSTKIKQKKKKVNMNELMEEPTGGPEENRQKFRDLKLMPTRATDNYKQNASGEYSSTSNEVNENIHVSTLRDAPVVQKNSTPELLKDYRRVEKKIKPKKKRDSKLACSETLGSIQEASSSLKDCESSSIYEYSPDFFEGVIEDTYNTIDLKTRGKNLKHVSLLERKSNSKENSMNCEEHDALVLEGHFNGGNKNIKKKKKDESELSCSQTLEQLVQKASSSLKNCESTSTNEYSPDLFDAIVGDTNEINNVNKERHNSQNHDSNPEELSYFQAFSSNELKDKNKLSGEKQRISGLENVTANSSPEVIDYHSPWHRLSQDSNGSFTGHSVDSSKFLSQASYTCQNKHILHGTNGQDEINQSHAGQKKNSSSVVELKESSWTTVLSLPNPSKVVLKKKSYGKADKSFQKKKLKNNKELVKSRNSKNKTESQDNTQIAPSRSRIVLNKQRHLNITGKTLEIKEKMVAKQDKVKCTRCRLWFDSALLMALHRCIDGRKNRTINEPHRTNYAVHKCECGKVYMSKSSLGVHIKSVHLGLRPWQCDECPMSFSAKQTLNVHKRFHSNTLPFECRICSKQTRTVWNLHRHYSQVHRLTPSFPCIFCPHKNVCFYFEHDLKEHMGNYHRSSTISTIKCL